jgi:L-ribulose-5-phosphate 3-epimerase
MRLACGTLSYRQEPLERALEGIARAGFPAVELGAVCGYCEHVRPEAMSATDMAQLGDQVAGFGLEIASIAGHVDLEFPLLGKGPEVAREGLARLRSRIELASRLGVPIVNTGIGVAQDPAELEEFYRGFDALLADAAAQGVKIGLESHAGLTATAAASLALCRRMGRPNLGINYDAANVRFYTGGDPVADLENCAGELGAWLIHVHIKDHAGGQGEWNFPPLGQGSLDFPRLAALFRRIGYDGPYSLEIEFQGPDSTDPSPEIIDQGVAESYQFMRRLLEGSSQ